MGILNEIKRENISSSNKKDKCPKCGGDLVKRNGKYGSF